MYGMYTYRSSSAFGAIFIRLFAARRKCMMHAIHINRPVHTASTCLSMVAIITKSFLYGAHIR